MARPTGPSSIHPRLDGQITTRELARIGLFTQLYKFLLLGLIACGSVPVHGHNFFAKIEKKS